MFRKGHRNAQDPHSYLVTSTKNPDIYSDLIALTRIGGSCTKIIKNWAEILVAWVLLPAVGLTSEPNSHGFWPYRDCIMAIRAVKARSNWNSYATWSNLNHSEIELNVQCLLRNTVTLWQDSSTMSLHLQKPHINSPVSIKVGYQGNDIYTCLVRSRYPQYKAKQVSLSWMNHLPNLQNNPLLPSLPLQTIPVLLLIFSRMSLEKES